MITPQDRIKAAEARKHRQLTLKEKHWVKAYLKTGNASEATRQAYTTKNAQSNLELSKQVKRRPVIQLAIAKAEARHGLDPDYVVGQLKANMDAAGIRANATDANRAIDIWARIHKLYDIGLPQQGLRETLRVLPSKELVSELERRQLSTTRLLSDLGHATINQ